MFFGVSRNADAEVGALAIFDIQVEVFAVIHVVDLFDQIEGEFMATGLGFKLGIELPRITAQGQHVLYVEEVEVDQGILGLLAGEASTQQMRHGVYAIAVHDGGANADGTRPLANGDFFIKTRRILLVDELFAVIGDVDKRGFEFHQGI